MNDLNHVWSQVVDNLYKKMTNVHFNSWIKPLIPLRLDGDTLYINANINLIKNIIVDKYLDTDNTDKFFRSLFDQSSELRNQLMKLRMIPADQVKD